MKTHPLTRAERNHNPGNIRRCGVRYRGERRPSCDPAFKEFESDEWGYRAMFVLLHTYATKRGCRTLRAMINRYAPPTENFTEGYLRCVTNATHLSPDEPISTTDGAVMTAIVAAMSAVENGIKANMRDVWRGWELFIADFSEK